MAEDRAPDHCSMPESPMHHSPGLCPARGARAKHSAWCPGRRRAPALQDSSSSLAEIPRPPLWQTLY